jgi:hypothetical protein
MKRERRRGEDERLLDNLRAMARSEERDWEDQDWHCALRRATAGKSNELRPAPKPRPDWAWAYAIVIVILLGAAAVTVRSFFHAAGPTLLARVEPAGSAAPVGAGGTASLASQNQLSVTFVSGESGLRVNWYFDKEFEWEE